MRIIFLDFDGVLNSSKYFQKLVGQDDGRLIHPYADSQIDSEAVALINDIVEKTGAKIVVSSAWRIGYEKEELQETLAERGFKGEIHDVTPVRQGDGLRHREIGEWLEAHPEVKQFVIIDDMWAAGTGRMANFVGTQFKDGLTRELADAAIEILLEEPE